MTGGVSLAVWMGGVAREIDLLMQASRARRAVPNPDILYTRLLDLLDILVEVDVLSGTSAGGINAVLLAYVRARHGDLSKLRDSWLDLGTLLELLRDPADSDVPSLLYGDRRMLRDLNKLLLDLAPGEPPTERPSTTLYVTTTLLTGESSRFTDAMGTLVQDTNHRGLFTFTETDLATKGIESALALAARSTASFPGAFEPSFIPFENPTKPDGEVPARPAMKNYANITRDHWAVDGGLLDNQPLDVLLERIFDRPAHRPVRRVLLYIVPSSGPSPDLVAATPGDDGTAPYGLLRALLKDLGAATSQSVSVDLRAIVAYNDRISARTDLRLQLTAMANRLGQARLLTPSLLDDYRARESERQARKLVKVMLRLLSTWPPQTPATPVGIPTAWQAELKPGGDERICEEMRTTLASAWPRGLDGNGTPSQDALPAASTQFAEFGRSAYDNGKSIALMVVRLTYKAATTTDDRKQLSKLITDIHSAAGLATRPSPADLAEDVCRDAVALGRQPRSLTGTAAALAQDWAGKTGVDSQAWDALAAALHGAAGRLRRIAQSTAADPELPAYVTYLRPDDAVGIATRLFDLAVSEQALLPVGAGPYQPVELMQLSADTRGLLTPNNSTAASKLTGLQFHHFGAFYKRSWRANDWMWGRLDAAGWLVHALLDPRRLRVVAHRQPTTDKVTWLLGELEKFGPMPLENCPAASDGSPMRDAVRSELAFLDDPTAPVPQGVPHTSLWVATAWQHRLAADELPNLAEVIIGESGKQVDSSPAATRTWAKKVLTSGADLDTLLKTCPVPQETFATDRGSPLMVHTVAKAVATTTAAVSTIRQMPGPVRPALTTAHTIALGGYRIANTSKGQPRNLIFAGLMLLVLGIAAAAQSSDVFGIGGLITAAIGGYLVTFGAWQVSARLLTALVGITLTGAVASLAAPSVRGWLFGASSQDTGYVGHHVHWLATAWWHPLLLVGIFVLLITLVGAVASRPQPAKR
jgi:patatin-related protein